MARRERVDGVNEALRIAASAQREVLPPDHVTLADGDLPFWQSVVAEFPKADWTAHQLEVAAQLAKAMADLETERNALRVEGYVLTLGDKQVANPRHGVARDLGNSCMSLRRNLQLHARGKEGEARDAGKRKAIARAVQSDVTPGMDDDFIARPASRH